jgi:hypothetical protein
MVLGRDPRRDVLGTDLDRRATVRSPSDQYMVIACDRGIIRSDSQTTRRTMRVAATNSMNVKAVTSLSSEFLALLPSS